MVAFRNILRTGFSNAEKLSLMTKDIDTVILAADANNKITILYSPKNFDSNRSRSDNKVICMLGLSAQATYVLVNLKTALADSHLMVQYSQRYCQHCSSQWKWPRGIQRLINFHCSPWPLQNNPHLRDKQPIQIDPNSEWVSKNFWFGTWEKQDNDNQSNHSCRQSQHLALWHESWFNQRNQIPSCSRQPGNSSLL